MIEVPPAPWWQSLVGPAAGLVSGVVLAFSSIWFGMWRADKVRSSQKQRDWYDGTLQAMRKVDRLAERQLITNVDEDDLRELRDAYETMQSFVNEARVYATPNAVRALREAFSGNENSWSTIQSDIADLAGLEEEMIARICTAIASAVPQLEKDVRADLGIRPLKRRWLPW